MDGITADYSVTPRQLGEVVEKLTEINQPVMVWGPPGVGKSDVMRQVAGRTGRDYIDVRALELDPVDIRGVPTVTDGRTVWATPGFLPPMDSEDRWLINLEELSAAPPSVQAAMYQLVLDRRVGDSYHLPEGAAIVACGNRVSDRGVAYRMPKPLANRMTHIDLRTDVGEWCDWALDNGVAAEVVFFIRFRPDLLFSFDPSSDENAFPTPRMWERAGSFVGMFPDPDIERTIMRGTVGEGAAVEFTAFLGVWRDLDDPRMVLDNPETARIPRDRSAQIATCGAVARIATEDDMAAVTTYASRMGREIGEYFVSSTVRMHNECQYTRAYLAWCQATA